MPLFLLTHPVWDVTLHLSSALRRLLFLLTHPVWDVTTVLNLASAGAIFLLTHPVWDVTGEAKDFNDLVDISTHTSRVGCDG